MVENGPFGAILCVAKAKMKSKVDRNRSREKMIQYFLPFELIDGLGRYEAPLVIDRM